MKNYDENEGSSCLEYLDANNLYGWAMIPPLPVNDFEFIRNVSKLDEDSDKGYVLEVDAEYPKNLHERILSYQKE